MYFYTIPADTLTGLLDPQISVIPTAGQIDHLIGKINDRIEAGERVLVTTLTKRMARELAEYFGQMGIPARYIHDEIDTLERIQILRDLRLGVFSVLVGINMLREGLDLPEVSLVAILDADKQGFLRSAWSLIQTCGRAARNVRGEVLLYADRISEAMRVCIDETRRRREVQEAYNREHGIKPASIVKEMPKPFAPGFQDSESASVKIPEEKVLNLIEELRIEMEKAAREMQFERAAMIRDEIIALQEQNLETRVLETLSKALKKGKERGLAKKGRQRPPRHPIPKR